MKRSRIRKAIKRKALQSWLEKYDSGIIKADEFPSIEQTLDTLTQRQLEAVLKVVCCAHSHGWRNGSTNMRELLLKKYRTHHTLWIDSQSGNVSIYDDNGDFVDKVNNLDEADRMVNQRNQQTKTGA